MEEAKSLSLLAAHAYESLALPFSLLQFEHQVEAVTPKYINSLVELISNGLDSLRSSFSAEDAALHAQQSARIPHVSLVAGAGAFPFLERDRSAPSGGGAGAAYAAAAAHEACTKHFRAQLNYINEKKKASRIALVDEEGKEEKTKDSDWGAVQIGESLKKVS